MKTISFSDLRRVSWLSEYSEVELLHIDMDDKVAEALSQLGFDTEYPILYYPAKHRNLAGDVVTGYIACGEIQLNGSKVNRDFRDLTDILVCTSYLDKSLMLELAELAFKTRDFTEFLQDSDSIDFDEERALFPANQLEPDWVEQEAIIKNLQDVLTMIRGPVYNASGALKTAEEYKEFAEAREFYEEKYAAN